VDVRRSQTLGEMARHQLSLDLDTSTDTSTESPAPSPGRTPARQVVLHVHLSDQAITVPSEKLHLARVANTRSFVDADQVRTWCRAPGVQIT